MPRARTAGWCRCHRRRRPWRRSRPRAKPAALSRSLRAWFAPGRPEHRTATTVCPAAAGKDFIHVWRIFLIAPDLVVVGQLVAGLDGADGLDEYASIIDQRLAMGIAGMVDEARIVATGTAAVDDDRAIDDKQESVIVVAGFVPITVISLPMRHAVAQILDDARPFANAAQCKHPAAVQARAAHLQHVRPSRNRRHEPRLSSRLSFGLTVLFACPAHNPRLSAWQLRIVPACKLPVGGLSSAPEHAMSKLPTLDL